MQKTKLGVSVGLLGAAAYFSSLFAGYVALFLIAGYVLLFEENEWLKKTAVKAVALTMAISVVVTAIGLIPDCLNCISNFLGIFNVYVSLSIVTSIISVVVQIINILENVLFLILGLKALNQGTITIPVVDNLINKYMN